MCILYVYVATNDSTALVQKILQWNNFETFFLFFIHKPGRLVDTSRYICLILFLHNFYRLIQNFITILHDNTTILLPSKFYIAVHMVVA